MKKISTIIVSLLLAAVFTLPVFARAATSPGVKPGSFFYFFDTAFEKVGMFFTFNPEKKARRALQYADERLAEIEVIAEEKDTDAVKKAISNYESNVALAAEKSKEVTDKAKAERLLVSIEDNAAKNQEVLSVVLTKVPEEAREAILRAISASRKGQEEAAKQIAELKGEVEKLKQEVEELKTKDEERAKVIEELGKQKTEKQTVQPKISAPASVAPTQKPEQAQTSPKTSIVTLPSGAVAEMDTNGNIIRYIKEATQQVNIFPSNPINSSITSMQKINITLGIQTIASTSAQIEWTTSEPTESNLYLSGGGISSKQYTSENGYTTKHIAFLKDLKPMTDYSFYITAIGNSGFTDYANNFKTKIPPPTLTFYGPRGVIPLGNGAEFEISWKSGWTDQCLASGVWSGQKSTSGKQILSLNQVGTYIYTLTCAGKNGENITENTVIVVLDFKPKITFYFNDIPSNTFSGKVGEIVKLRWETSNTSGSNGCWASNSWSGNKYIGGSQDILLEAVGEFSYTLTCSNANSGESEIKTATITVVP